MCAYNDRKTNNCTANPKHTFKEVKLCNAARARGNIACAEDTGKTLRVSWRPRLLSRVQSAMASYTPLLSLSRPHRRTTRGGGPETKIYGVETVSRTIMSIVIVQGLFISRPIHSIFIGVLFFLSIRNHRLTNYVYQCLFVSRLDEY